MYMQERFTRDVLFLTFALLGWSFNHPPDVFIKREHTISIPTSFFFPLAVGNLHVSLEMDKYVYVHVGKQQI